MKDLPGAAGLSGSSVGAAFDCGERGQPERFPPEYNQDPSVTVEVKPGENTIDFDVETDQETFERTQES